MEFYYTWTNLGSPALGLNGRVLLIGGDGWMYSIYANDGTLDWEVSTGSPHVNPIGSPAVSDDGTIFAADHNGLFAFTPNGSQLWSKPSPFFSSPAIGWNGYIYIGISTVEAQVDFWCIDPNDGTILWNNSMVSTIIYSTATVGYDGSVYVGGYDGLFCCINGTTGELKWSIDISRIYYASASIGPDGSVYISNDNYMLYAFLGTTHLFCWH